MAHQDSAHGYRIQTNKQQSEKDIPLRQKNNSFIECTVLRRTVLALNEDSYSVSSMYDAA